ncbi:PepSY-associated TM helix domain-containing protein [Pseudoteredinibacter isoporae]|uniref:Putative iron-regulated membrane protein n=1 Tax=Pseudoteredinibacter isoporae TaxID=570281 RepID=A0A7X0JS43_9GAMM|nr:PepSY-associated TM helix domain-containing protein [Pseudoteredinibacter isoporae]MBB6521270.1 putative iron-regulated membrane protein [Pseudoteredinibacter isoporae]NHO86828.1 PepSY domain-containing protein [Pseudoteredinibacter isoporae]NIB24720.1 PepSY domain-containing protein [Pseudoteredinibacter isoporae]
MFSVKKNKSNKRRLYQLHASFGFHLAALLSLVLITGTIAVVSDEIDWLFLPQLRASEGEQKQSWGAMELAIKQHAPGHALVRLETGEGDYLNYRASMLDLEGKRYYLYIDPHTAAVTGRTGTLTVQRFFRDLHRYLFMPGIIGLPVVCSLALVLALMMYTGLATSRPWTKKATRLRFQGDSRISVSDGHKVIGIWGSWFLLLMILTSVWYLAEWGGLIAGKRFEPQRPGLSKERVEQLGTQIVDLNADALIAAARQAYPQLQPTEIQFARTPKSSVIVLGHTDDWLVRSRANRVFLDPVSAEVIKVQRSTELGAVAYLNEMADPWHFGSFASFTSKLIWFLFGVGLSFLSLSGVWLYWKRVRSMAPSKAQYYTLGLVALTFVIGFFYVRLHLSTPGFPRSSELPTLRQEGIQARLLLETDSSGQYSGNALLRINASVGRPNIKTAEFALLGLEGKTFTARARGARHIVWYEQALDAESLVLASGIQVNVKREGRSDLIFEWPIKR